MAVRETLELDLRGALAQINTLEREINDLRRPVNIPVDVTGSASAEIRTIDDRLDELVSSTSDLNRELAEMSIHAGDSVADFSRLASEMGIAEGQARDLAGEILEARNSSVRVADAAKDVARQMGLSEAEASQFADEVGRAAGKVDQLDVAAGKASGGGLSKLGAGLKNLLVTAAAFVGVREIFSFFSSSIQSFSNLEESTSKANVVFGDFADTVFRFTDNAPEQLGQTQQAAIEAAASFGNLFLSIGLGQDEAAEMSTVFVQLATDIASFNNISVDEAMQKLRAGLIGEAEPLRAVGVLLSEAAVQSKALELGMGGLTGKLTEAEKVQARYAIILDQTTTAQGDFARTADGVANSQRTLAASFEELKTQIGGAILPLFQSLLDAAPPLIASFESMIPQLQTFAETLGDVASIGGPVLGFLVDVQAEVAQLGSILIEVLKTDIADVGNIPGIVNLSRALRGVREAIAAGATPARVYGDALTFITNRADVTAEALTDLADATGVSALEQAEALRLILDNPGDATSEELVILRNRLVDVEEQLRGASEANRDWLFIAATFAQVTEESIVPLQSQATTLFLLRGEADLLGISLAELVSGGAEKFPELAGLIGQLEPATLGLATAQDNLATFAATFEETNIRISDAIDEFGLLPEKLDITVGKFTDNLTLSAEEEATFQANLVKLFLIAPALATFLQEQGPTTRGLVAGYLKDNTGLTAEAEAALTGNAEELTGAFTTVVNEAITTAGLDQSGIDALLLFLEGFGNTTVAEAGVEALGGVIQTEIDKLKFTIAGGQFSFEEGLAPGEIPASIEEQLSQGFADMGKPVFDALVAELVEQGIDPTEAATIAGNLVTPEVVAAIAETGQPAFDGLVAEFVKLGITLGEAKKIANNLVSAEVVAALGEAGKTAGGAAATGTVSEYQAALLAEVEALSTGPIETVIGDQVTTAFDAGAAAEVAAGETVDAYEDEIVNRTGSDALSSVDLAAAVEAAFASDETLNAALQAGQAASAAFWAGAADPPPGTERDLRDSIASTMSGAIYADSPPKLFVDFGIVSGEAFWAGFEDAQPPVVPLPEVSGELNFDVVITEAFDAGDQAAVAADQTVTDWEDAAVTAAENLSAAELQDRLGDLFSGVEFVIGSDQFTFPTAFSGVASLLVNPTGTVPTGTTGVNVTTNIYNPTVNDLGTSVAQANQSTAAVGTYLNRLANT